MSLHALPFIQSSICLFERVHQIQAACQLLKCYTYRHGAELYILFFLCPWKGLTPEVRGVCLTAPCLKFPIYPTICSLLWYFVFFSLHAILGNIKYHRARKVIWERTYLCQLYGKLISKSVSTLMKHANQIFWGKKINIILKVSFFLIRMVLVFLGADLT